MPESDAEKFTSLSEKLYEGASAEYQLEELLSNAGAEFESISWDEYDNSLELRDVPPDHRLPAAAQRVIYDAGFAIAYVNHTDKWETHYSFRDSEDFKISEGWRVSYPYKRHPDDNFPEDDNATIWVEEFVGSWPKEWFDTGYVTIKKVV